MTSTEYTLHAKQPFTGYEIWTTPIDADGRVKLLWASPWHPGRNSGYSYIPNVEMFQAALDWITNNPQTWNQAEWFSNLPQDMEPSLSAAPECGTAGCLAGTVLLLNGVEVVPGEFEPQWNFTDDEGDYVSAGQVADQVLGIPSRLSDQILYYHMNHLWQLWDYAQVFCGGALTLPERSVIEEADQVSKDFYSEENGE